LGDLMSACLRPVAAPVAVGELVERRHPAAGSPALDEQDQGFAVEYGFPQVGAVRHLAVELAPVACPAVARLAVALLAKQPRAGRDIRRIRGLCMRGRAK